MDQPKPPISIDEFRKKRNAILNHGHQSDSKPSALDRFAVWITQHVGSMGFFLVIFTWTVLWLGWNILAPKPARFDPYPAFVLWLFISNMIQLFLLPLIMIGQNVQSKHADLRAEIDFKINAQAELETETILTHLEYQNQMILKILEDLEKKV